MRTPPPVLDEENPPPAYKTTYLDRHGPDGALNFKRAAYALMVFWITFAGVLIRTGSFLAALISGAMFAGLSAFIAYWLSAGAGDSFKAFLWPSGASTPYEQTFSFQEALAAKGDMAGALESYEAVISEQPTAVSPRMKAAEHYAKGNRDPKRASELFREIRGIVGVTPRDALYASSRLVDLYQGPLNDPGRAIVELRRIIEEHPSSPAAKFGREALPALKARHEASKPQV